MLKSQLSTLFILLITMVSAQSNGTLTGQVIDNKTLLPLEGATVLIEGTSIGVITGADGYFSIQDVTPQTYSIVASFLGYTSETKFNVIVKSVGTADLLFKLEEDNQILDEVVVVKSSFRTTKETPLSTQSLSAVEIETYPGGNNDIAKVAQSLPGISPSIGGFRNDFIIRGGAPNESVYYLDGIEIPNINHFSTQGSAGGPVGMLNVDFIRNVTLSSSAFGAEYDNPLSGVLAFEQRDGNTKDFAAKVRVGASEAGITINTPLFKGNKERSNTTLMLSARRSYLQFIFELVGLPIRPDYWDYQWKLTHNFDTYNSISFIGLGSIDDFSVVAPDEFDAEQQATIEQVPIIQQRTTTLGLSWTRKFKSGNGRMLTTLSTNRLQNLFSRFRENESKSGLLFENDAVEQETKLRSQITQYSGDWKYSYGFNLQLSKYSNATLSLLENFNYATSINFTKYGLFGKASRSYFNERLSLSLGVRLDADSFTTGSSLIDNFSPRVAASYRLTEDERWKVNASVGRYFKMPTYTMLGFQDLAGNFINQNNRYTQSDHYVVGVEYNWSPTSRITIEGFLKDYSQYPVSVLDQVSLANKGGGFEVLGNEPIVDSGEGQSYGMEVLFQQKLTKNFYGVLAYTYFFSQFSQENGPLLPTVWDSRNLLSFTGGYKLKRNWEVSLRYRYAGKTPYVPTDVAASLADYPRIVLDYNRLGDVSLEAFTQGDIRIDKKWNFKRLSFNFYLEVQNFLAQAVPRPQEYGLERTETGQEIQPRNLIVIDTDRTQTPLPSFGFVFDF
ncbi:TonB-dependent receptor [Flavobacteriaceae bacterium]|nr:TonB-dependent receptor [Flavobacteriaceae bacterium]MDA9330512.1 TonB-dependent receptor [Flavobacteriaceae bacterium]